MKFLHALEKFTGSISRLPVPKLATIFFLFIITSFAVALLYHLTKVETQSIAPPQHHANPIWPTRKETSDAVVSQSIISAEPIPAPIKTVGITIGESLLSLNDDSLNSRLLDIQKLGVSWLRVDLSWSSIQPQDSSYYDWSRFDRLVSAANTRGFKILPIIAYTPRWARSSECDSDKCAPADPNKFAAFAATAASRYRVKGIHTWEIWNEPNMKGFWKPAPNPVAYTELLKVASRAIKRSDPNAFIILGSTGSTDYDGGIPQLDFLSSIYSAGGRNYFDAIGYHPYSFPVLPTDYYEWNAWSKMFRTPISFKSIMASNGDSTKKIWVTEFGAPTGGPGSYASINNYNFDRKPDHVDETLQAKMATTALNDYKLNDILGNFFWYSYQDNGASGSTESFYGLLRDNGTAKLSYQTLKDAVTNLKK
jgi:hypothetical protein